MPGKGHSEEKIVYALRQVEAGKKVSEVGREMGASVLQLEAALRRARGLNELRELRPLREENWTSTSCRKCSPKKPAAWGAAEVGEQYSPGVRAKRASRLWAGRHHPVVQSLLELSRFPS